MTTAKELYSLQELDLALDSLDRQKAGAEKEFEVGPGIETIEAAHQEEIQRLAEVQQRYKNQQPDLESQRERLAHLDSQLYGGEVANPRDLSALQQEAANARNQLEKQDAASVELSLQAEESRERCAALEKEIVDTRLSWERRHAELKETIGRLTAEREIIAGQKTKLVATLEAAALKQYESLRRAKGGLAVAKVVRGLCQGCRMSLPTQQQQSVKGGRRTVLCSTCGRILFLS